MTRGDPFFGRTREIGEVCGILRRPETSVVTVTGIGGMGKTSLARRVMEEMETEFRGGGVFLPLTRLEHSRQLAPAVLSAMGSESFSGDPEQRLMETFSRREVLLVLDNFEHIVSASPVVESLSRRAVSSRILVTSRSGLGFGGEVVYRLQGFEERGSGNLRDLPSVKLFIASSGLDDQFSEEELIDIAAICRNLSGIPLGIKLAASMASRMSTSEILELISDPDELLDVSGRSGERRHRNLRTVFNYSWRFLDPEERKAFSSLSIFRGPFDPLAAERITGTFPGVLDALWSKSLLESERDNRFSMHPLLNGYAFNRLQDSMENTESLRNRHTAFFCNRLGDLRESINTRRSIETMNTIDTCYADFSSAVSGAFRLGMQNELARALRTLRIYFVRKGLIREAEELYSKAVDFYDALGSPFLYEFLVDLGSFRTKLQKYEEAVKCFEKALKTPEVKVQASCFYELGITYMRTGNLKRAEELMSRALEKARESGDSSCESFVMTGLGDIYNHLHESDKAEYFMKLAIEKSREDEDVMNRFSCFVTLSNVMFNHQRPEEALDYAERALHYSQYMAGDFYSGLAEACMAGALELHDRCEEALAHAEKAVKYFGGIDSRWGLQIAYGLLSSNRSKLGMTEESIRSATRLRELCTELGPSYNTMEYLITVGEVFERAGLKQDALEAFKRSKRIAANLKVDVYLEKISQAITRLES